jgi:hypothetical protein
MWNFGCDHDGPFRTEKTDYGREINCCLKCGEIWTVKEPDDLVITTEPTPAGSLIHREYKKSPR